MAHKESVMPQCISMLWLFAIACSPSLAFAESVAAAAYITMGSGILVVLGLATYIIKQMRYLIRQHSNKPAD